MSNTLKAIAEYAVDNASLDIRRAISTIEVWGQELEYKVTARQLIERILDERDLEADQQAEVLEEVTTKYYEE